MSDLNDLMDFAWHVGSVLLLCFTSYLLEHKGLDNPGVYFADNMSQSINEEFSKNYNYLEIGLSEMVDFRTLVKAFFYSDLSGRYWKSKNLGGYYTFMDLWDEAGHDTGGVDCSYSTMTCNIHEDLLKGEEQYLNYEEDFRVSSKSFYYQLLDYPKDSFIPWNVYYGPRKRASTCRDNDRPCRFLNSPDTPQFYRYKVDKDLNLSFEGIPSYSFLVDSISGTNYTINTSRPLVLSNNGENRNQNWLLNTRESELEFVEGFMIQPEVPIEQLGNMVTGVMTALNGNKKRDRLTYTSQPFLAESAVIYGNVNWKKEFNVSDRYYLVEDELERGGHADEYNSLWVFGELNNSIANNLTLFAECIKHKLFAKCTEEYLKWYDPCHNGVFNDLIINNLKSLGLWYDPNPIHKNNNFKIVIIVTFTLLIVIMFVVSIFGLKSWMKTASKSTEESLENYIMYTS